MEVTIHYWESFTSEHGAASYPHVSLSTSSHYFSLHPIQGISGSAVNAKLVPRQFDAEKPDFVIKLKLHESRVDRAIGAFMSEFNEGRTISWLDCGQTFSPQISGFNNFSLALAFLWMGGIDNFFDPLLLGKKHEVLCDALFNLGKIPNVETIFRFCKLSNPVISPNIFLSLVSEVKPIPLYAITIGATVGFAANLFFTKVFSHPSLSPFANHISGFLISSALFLFSKRMYDHYHPTVRRDSVQKTLYHSALAGAACSSTLFFLKRLLSSSLDPSLVGASTSDLVTPRDNTLVLSGHKVEDDLTNFRSQQQSFTTSPSGGMH